MFGKPALVGTLVEVRPPDEVRVDFWRAMVQYEDQKLPVATDLDKLDWVVERAGSPPAAETGGGGPELPLDL